jgi:hypothetical protein
MRKKILWLSLVLLLVCPLLLIRPLSTLLTQHSVNAAAYPHFLDHPHLTDRQRALMAPHLLPLTHPLKNQLDALFSRSRITASKETLIQAGFQLIASMPGSFVIVARHPEVPGYVFKLYLDTETRMKEGIPNCEWLAKRCIGAHLIRQIILNKRLKHFTIPDKWLYVIPPDPPALGPVPQPVLVIETDMQLVDEDSSKHAWRSEITPEHLAELYSILKHGYGSIRVAENIPFTQQGTFAFTDTEYPKRKFKLKRVTPYLSEEMQSHWKELSQ